MNNVIIVSISAWAISQLLKVTVGLFQKKHIDFLYFTSSGGMTTSDWINIIAARIVGGGTIFLGIKAWRTIRQARSIQKAEKRERLLNEIIEWATNLANVAFGHAITPAPTEEEIRENLARLGNNAVR